LIEAAENGLPRSYDPFAQAPLKCPQRPLAALEPTPAQFADQGDRLGIALGVALAPFALAGFTPLALAGTA
jgi:hypothetical protein